MKSELKRLFLTTAFGFIATVSVLAKNDYVAYLFTYFTGNAPEQEQICYALSNDGWNYTPLNNGRPVIASDSIALTKCVRDPHILRGEDGWFYQVITDMKSSLGWSSNRGMVLMRSRNLIQWEHHTIHFPERYKGTMFANVTRVWAPQTIYDKEAGKYMVYFSILTNDGSCPYDRVYYAYANSDFSDLEGEPKVLFDVKDAAIDTDIVRDDEGLYHVFFKTEGQRQKGIKQFITPSLLDKSKWQLQPGMCQDTNKAVEGGGVFRLFDGTWVLMYDCYTSGHYQFCKSTDLRTFKRVQDTQTSGAFTPRHGTVIAITKQEYELLTAWDTLLQADRDLKSRPIPTLTLKQLDQRKALIDETRHVLAGKATAKAFKAQAGKIQKFLK
ncbi:MAG: glycoside hydrolase family 43 protein [Bacteroidaceae bacterium]|nr:glycoside hydrolase family 43 protein [Bacteroidaceae bacterium]